MAQLRGSQPQNISLFPPPPIYAEHYTSENIRKGVVLPPPPVPSKFEVFGESYDLEGVKVYCIEN